MGLAVMAVLVVAPGAEAQIAVSSNDSKLVLVNGVTTGMPNAPADTATVLDLSAFPPKVLAEIEVPGSVVGPPFSVAITPDEGLAFSSDGQTLLAQNMVEREIWVFRVGGAALRDTGHRIKVNGGPAAIRIADKSR